MYFMHMDQPDDFFSQIALQLRYSLSNLHMAAAALVPAEERERDEALDQRAAILDQSFYQMLRLVNQLSAAAYLNNDAPLPVRNCDMGELVEEVCGAAESLAPLRGLTFCLENRLGHHVCAVARDAMEHLLYNLLSNAFKFTPAGGTVTVTAERKEGSIRVQVRDTGCGMTAEQLETLFDTYLHAAPVRTPPRGLGLGLALCHRIACAHGGVLMASSREGEGSVFTLSFPDRMAEDRLSDTAVDYSGGFSRALLGLADALPAKAFRVREQ